MKTVPDKTADLTPPAEPYAARPPAFATLGEAGLLLRRYGFLLTVVVAVGLVAAGQLVEDLADSAPLQMMAAPLSMRRWAIVVLVLYVFLISEVVERTVQRSLASLRPVLLIDAPTFAAYERRTTHSDLRVDLVLVAISAFVVGLLFLGLGLDLPVMNDPVTNQALFLPADPARALVVLAGYTVLGWAGLRIIYLASRLGRVLGQLSREPLRINVFDTSPLLPFGNIALAVALAPVGIIVILLIGLGQPNSLLSWTVLLLASVASLLALLLPLRGIHEQMSAAKDTALGTVNAQISALYDEMARSPTVEPDDLTRLRDGANTYLPFRKTIEEMTTWPFRDTVALGRAVLIASAPLIYTTLSELIRVFWINPLNR